MNTKKIIRPFCSLHSHLATKNYKCALCDKKISTGTLYYRKKGLDKDGVFYSTPFCSLCVNKVK